MSVCAMRRVLFFWWWMWIMCKSFLFSTVPRHIIHSFIRIVCSIEFPLLIWTQLSSTVFIVVSPHCIKSYGAFDVNRARPARYGTHCENPMRAHIFIKYIDIDRYKYSHFNDYVLLPMTHNETKRCSCVCLVFDPPISSDKDHFDNARKYLKPTGFRLPAIQRIGIKRGHQRMWAHE